MSNPHFRFLFITSDPAMASYVLGQGVDQVFLDLEVIGKVERQGHLDTVISRHSMDDVSVLHAASPAGALLVRLNPIHPGTETEIDVAIRRGASTLMLPMFRTPAEVERFCRAVNRRVRVCLLVETIGAMESLAECISISGVDEVHIGLNDLHLEMGCRFMFEPLASGHVERMADVLRSAQKPFGIGGLARIGEGLLPAELLLTEHARLGSTCAILSRTFHRGVKTVDEMRQHMDFGAEVRHLRFAYKTHVNRRADEIEAHHQQLKSMISGIVNGISHRSTAPAERRVWC
jgi:2-keto-3-deoxy-L-rhamnonate aldolase RhmA